MITTVDLLVRMGYRVVRCGRGYHIIVRQRQPGDLSSLSIYPDGCAWKRWSNGTHGGDALELCRVVFGMSYAMASAYVAGVGRYDLVQHVAPVLLLPDRYQGKYSRVYAYLCKTRCIASDVVTYCIQHDLLYQDTRGNAVFVGYDGFGVARYACLHGTGTAISYRSECCGSDKRYSFSVPARAPTSVLCVYESPIDLLSAVSLAGWSYNRLSLGGVSDVALAAYLDDHCSITTIHLWLDSDDSGRSASDRICSRFADYDVILHRLPHVCKDVNDFLRIKKKNNRFPPD